MAWNNLRRILVGMVLLASIWVLAIVVEGAFAPLNDVLFDGTGFGDSPWGEAVSHLSTMATVIIALLILGVFAWMIIGPIQETRVEVEQRRIR